MEMQVSDDYLEIKKKKKAQKNRGDGLSLYCTTTLLLRKCFSDLYSVGKI